MRSESALLRSTKFQTSFDLFHLRKFTYLKYFSSLALFVFSPFKGGENRFESEDDFVLFFLLVVVVASLQFRISQIGSIMRGSKRRSSGEEMSLRRNVSFE